ELRFEEHQSCGAHIPPSELLVDAWQLDVHKFTQAKLRAANHSAFSVPMPSFPPPPEQSSSFPQTNTATPTPSVGSPVSSQLSSPSSTLSSTSLQTSSPTHSTVTELPTGVLLVPFDLKGVTQTTPFYITTTSPGSDFPTIVPVIFPFDGPPVVCFSCFTKFPPNIEIRVPKFCIQLFGLKIGNCPPSDNGGGGGDDGGGDDDKPDPTEDDKGTGAQSDQQATPSCVTSAYTTITGCSATPAATTVRATSTVSHGSFEATCEPETCGGSQCPVRPRRGLLDEQQHRNLSKRGNPAEGEWPDPIDYENPNDFIGQQLIDIASGRGNGQNGRYNPILVLHGSTMNGVSEENAGMTTANHIIFRSRVAAIALQGLYGCKSVVVVSRRGAWVSHIWERDMTLQENFQDKIIGKDDDEDGPSIRRGLKETNRDFRFFTHGLEDMVENVEDRRSGFTFGDVLPDAVEKGDTTNKTSKDLNTRAFIFTPRHRFDRYRDGKLIPESEFLNNMELKRGTIRNGLRVARPSGFISDIYGGIDVDVVDYLPLPITNEMSLKYDQLEAERRATGRKEHVTEAFARSVDISNYMSIKQAGTPRGKLLLQYKPSKTCNDKAAWR
ncbi:hypothetical protein CPLU01_15721, partial [Colletotrichum plurivorum]